MKKFLLASLAVLCVLACPVSGSAQGILSYDVTGGISLPMGNLGDAVGTGYGVGWDVFCWSPSGMPELQVGARIAENFFTSSENSTTFFGFTTKTKASLNNIEIMPSVRYTLPSSGKMTYFGQVGFGFFIESMKVETSALGRSASATNSDNKVGLTLAGGAIMPVGSRQLVLMPLYSLVGDTNYLGLNIGVVMK